MTRWIDLRQLNIGIPAILLKLEVEGGDHVWFQCWFWSIFPTGSSTLLAVRSAIIEFDPTGKILSANENFCNALGYSFSEIKGKHHSMLVEPDYAQSPEYKAFWAKLGRGEFDAREYKRIGKGGREVWIQASYNPVKDAKGNVLKVVKVATDITGEKIRNAEFEGKVSAISRVQASSNSRRAAKSSPPTKKSRAPLDIGSKRSRGSNIGCRSTWLCAVARVPGVQKLNNGEYVAAEFKRIGKGGKEVWTRRPTIRSSI